MIGSGVTGCGVAYALLNDKSAEAQSLRVTVIEARNAVSGATGRNGGHLISDSDSLFGHHVQTLGEEEAIKILHFTEANIVRLKELTASLDPADREATELRTVVASVGFDMCTLEEAKNTARLLKGLLPERELAFGIISKTEAMTVG